MTPIVGGVDVLGTFNSEELSLPLELTSSAATSRLLGSSTTPQDVLEGLTGPANVTTNWHMYGVGWPQPFTDSVASGGMVALSTNFDRDGLEFVSTMEHKSLPIYATQWHPEANQVHNNTLNAIPFPLRFFPCSPSGGAI
jgi:hypothetical protein